MAISGLSLNLTSIFTYAWLFLEDDFVVSNNYPPTPQIFRTPHNALHMSLLCLWMQHITHLFAIKFSAPIFTGKIWSTHHLPFLSPTLALYISYTVIFFTLSIIILPYTFPGMLSKLIPPQFLHSVYQKISYWRCLKCFCYHFHSKIEIICCKIPSKQRKYKIT